MEEQPHHLERLPALLVIAAGSVTTGVLAAIDHDRGSPLLWMLMFCWFLQGLTIGIWVLRGRTWKSLKRTARLRLGIGCFAIAWGALVGLFLPMTRTTPGVDVMNPFSNLIAVIVVVSGLALVLLFVASLIDDRQERQDQGDVFP